MNADPDEKERIFNAAVELKGAAQRQAFLDAACGQDSQLRREIEELLEHDEEAGSLLNRPAVAPVEVTSDSKSVMGGTDKQIGPYKLLQEIGEGGFGVVYMAQQQQPVRRKVALKIIKPGMDTREVIARFEAERQALAMMDHPNIARVLDVGTTESGRPYFAMELVQGVPITAYCDKNNMTPRERLQLFVTVCRAVQHAHQKGIIHRDIKPSNVMVTLRDGQPVPKVIDFGVAKAINQQLTEKTLFTRYGQMVGTPQYMSPEQAEMSELDVDTRSDIYSLGVLLYELLTGTTPLSPERLRDHGYAEIQRIICEDDPPTPSTRLSSLGDKLTMVARHRHSDPQKLRQLVRGELDWIVMKALDKERGRRYETASSFAADVEAYLTDDPVQACPPSAGYKLAKMYRKHHRVLNTAAAFALVLAIATAVSLWQAIVATKARGIADVQRNSANAERDRAMMAQANALRAQKELSTERDETAARADYWKHEFYRANILKARHFVEADNGGRAVEALNACPQELRHWEWHRLMYLADQSSLFKENLDQLYYAAFSPDGTKILSGQSDGSYRLWDVETQEQLWQVKQKGTWSQHNSQIPAFNSTWTRVATPSHTQIIVRDVTTGEVVKQRGNVRPRAFHADDQRILAQVDWNKQQPSIIDVMETQQEVVLDRMRPGTDWWGYADKAVFSRDGKQLAIANVDNNMVRIWEAESGRKKHTLRGVFNWGVHRPIALAFSPDGTLLASAGSDSIVTLWDTDTGDRRHPLIGHVGDVTAVVFSPDGTRIISGEARGSLKVWDVASGKELETLKGHASQVMSVHVHPDGQRIVSTSADGTIRIWVTGVFSESLLLRRHREPLRHLAFSPNGNLLVSSGWDRRLPIWDVATGEERRLLVGGHDIVAFSPKGTHIATGRYQREVDNGKRIRLEGEFKSLGWIAYSPDGSHIAAVATQEDTEELYLWDAETGAMRKHFPNRDDDESYTDGLAFSPSGKEIATCNSGRSGKVKIWDSATGHLQRTLVGPPAPMRGVAFSPDGTQLAVGCGKQVLVWNLKTHKLLQLRRHVGYVYSVVFSRDGHRLFSAGQDGTVRVWDLDNGTELLRISAGQSLIWCVAVSPDDKTLATAGQDGTVKLWETERRSAYLMKQRQEVRAATEETARHRNKGNAAIRQGRWKEAAFHYEKLLERDLEREDSETWMIAGCCLALANDVDEYRRLCRDMVEHFGPRLANDRRDVERAARICLLLREVTEKSPITDVREGPSTPFPPWKIGDPPPWKIHILALAAYRNGDADEALRLMDKLQADPDKLQADPDKLQADPDKPHDDPDEGSQWKAMGLMIHAMAQHKLNQTAAAQHSYTEGAKLIESKLAELREFHQLWWWYDWLVPEVLRREADALINGEPQGQPSDDR